MLADKWITALGDIEDDHLSIRRAIVSPETRNPKTETRKPKTETRIPKLETRNPKPETLTPLHPYTLHPTPYTLHPPEPPPKASPINAKPHPSERLVF